jgi:hypothetical protein
MDLERLIGASVNATPRQYLAVRANDSGLFVWMESGASPRSGNRTVTVHHITEMGGLLRSTVLPLGAGLSLTQDFGLDDAGNLYFLQTKPGAASGSDLALVKVDPRGEMIQEHDLAGRPSTFAVGRQGRVFLLTDDAEVRTPDSPATAIAQGNTPERITSGGPPRWLPLLELTGAEKLVLVDGVLGTFETLSGPVPGERHPIGSAELQAAVRHIGEAQTAHSGKLAGSVSLQPALRNSCVDEAGTLSFTLMGTRPSDGVVVVRSDAQGNSLPALRLEAAVDTNRPQAPELPPPVGEAALMFPHDLAVWRGKAFVLGVHGLLAVYDVR